MTHLSSEHQKIRRLAVRLPNWLGDICFSQPAIAALRRALPQAHLVGAAPQGLTQLLDCFELFDSVVALPTALLSRAAALRKQRLDAIVLLPNSFASALEAVLAAAALRIGFAGEGRSILLTHSPRRPREIAGRRVHQVDEYLALVRAMGISAEPVPPRLKPQTAQLEAARRLLGEAGFASGAFLLAICPGAAFGPSKCWPAERFAALAERIAQDRGAAIVLIGGAADRASCAAVADQLRRPAVNLCGRTDLGTLAGLLSLADLVLANDSGAYHLAIGLGTRAIGFYGPTDPVRTGPSGWNGVALHASLPCMPCYLRVCPLPRHRCMEDVSVAIALAAAQRLLGRNGAA